MAEKEKALSENGLLYLWKALKQIFAGKVDNVRYSGGKLYKDTTSYNAAGEPVGSATEVASASAIVTDGGGYKKPATGIPKTDLASGVQTSLDKADTALQSHQDISGKADKADFGFADGTAHTHTNDKTQGTALKVYNPTLGSGQTADVVNSSTISGEATEDSADAKTHIPTWQGIMKWVKSLSYATVSATNTALAGKSKVTVNQPTSGTGTGTQLTVDGTTFQVVIDTDPGTDNGFDYKMAPTWHQMRTLLAGKADSSALSGYVAVGQKGSPNGVATLGSDGKVPASQLPSYVDDVIEVYGRSGVTSLSADAFSLTDGGTALTPETGKIYVLMKAYTQGSGTSAETYKVNSQFRWSGSAYVPMFDGGVSWMTNAEIDAILAQ